MDKLIINKIEKTNIIVGDDGVKEYDLNITATYVPKTSIGLITLDLTILPTEITFK